MNITFEKTDEVSALLTLTLERADYEDKVTAALKDFRKKANMPGFRPGQAPMGMLRSRFGTEITAEQINKMLGEELYKYIREQKINMLGEPMANEEKTPAVDFRAMDTFTFAFDVALAPEFDAKISDKDKLDYCRIKVDDTMVEQKVQAYAQRGGQYSKVDSYEPKDMVKGVLLELDAEGKPLEEGVRMEQGVLLPDYMKNEEEKAKFAGAKVGDEVVFNPAKAFDGNSTELSSLLGIDKERAEAMKSDFALQISEITRYEPAAVDQKLFDSVYGEGSVKSEEEFRARVAEDFKKEYAGDSDYKFIQDLRKYLVARVGEVRYAEDILKRVMAAKGDDKEKEQSEESFRASLDELTWHLIKEQLSDQLGIKVEQADVLETAKAVTRMQFAQYGMYSLPEETLTRYANEMLKNERQAEGLVARTVEGKIASKAKEVVTLNEVELSMDDFNKKFREENK